MVRLQEMLFLVMAIFSITSNAFNTICPSVCTCKWKNGELITTCSFLRFKFTLVIVPPPACFFNLVRSHALSSRQPWLWRRLQAFISKLDLMSIPQFCISSVKSQCWTFEVKGALNNIWFVDCFEQVYLVYVYARGVQFVTGSLSEQKMICW